jgi:hypothetical protein
MSWAGITKKNLQNSNETSKYVPPSLKRNQKIEEKQEKQEKNLNLRVEEKIEQKIEKNNPKNTNKSQIYSQNYYWDSPKFASVPFVEEQIRNSYIKLGLKPPIIFR